MAGAPVLLALEDGVATVTLNAPPLNPSSEEMLEQLADVVGGLADDPAVRVLVLRGAGDKAFSAGGNIKQMQRRNPISQNAHGHRRVRRAFDAVANIPVPVIAAVRGFALGGGCELALACDFIVASDDAVFGLPEINLGVFPGAGGTQRLLRRVPVNVAKEIIMTGRRIPAPEALHLGLVNRMAAPDAFERELTSLVDELKGKSRLALAFAKRVISEGAEMPLANALTYEADLAALAFSSKDFQEGFAAFLEKRAARFTGE